MRGRHDDATIVVVRMDPQLQEIVKQIADAVEKKISRRFDEFDERIERRFSDFENGINARLDDFENGIGARFKDFEKRVDARFTDAEGRLAKRFDDAENRLAEGAKAHMDELRALVKLSAEGYGATLEKIQRELVALNTKVDSKFTDHAKARRLLPAREKKPRQQARRRSPPS